SFDLCDAMATASSDLLGIDGANNAILALFSVLGIGMAIAFFKLFVEG
ncbi:MAG: hypothetical protein RLZZ324_50, partial [Candidatus Parcubacteria bacterium]